MKSIVRKSLAAATALSTGLAPMTTQFTAASAARLATVSAVSAAVALAPSAAYAQKNKRMCGTVWDGGLRGGNKSGLAAVGMEVNKLDIVTCTGLVGAWVVLTSVPSGLQSLAQTLLGNAAGVGTGLIGSLRMMETCESFSRRVQANTNDVCLKMTDYRLYAFVKVYGGGFSMGKV